jgi:hypothetical protein
MSNNEPVVPKANIILEWNPFQDILANNIKSEPAIVTAKNKIVIPRSGPFFSKDCIVKVKDSPNPLSLANGDYGFIYPFGSFITGYNRNVYAGILLPKTTVDTNLILDYSSIGGPFVLDDIKYAQAVANIINNPRTADWSQIINLPTEFPSDPHPHPISDYLDYEDLITALSSYLTVISNNDNSVTTNGMLLDHIGQTLKEAHKGTLADLGVKNLKDYPMAGETDILGESNQLLTSLWLVKKLIRDFASGKWK